jgi:hypothetical protein
VTSWRAATRIARPPGRPDVGERREPHSQHRRVFNERHQDEIGLPLQSWNFQDPSWVKMRSDEAGEEDAYTQARALRGLGGSGVKRPTPDHFTGSKTALPSPSARRPPADRAGCRCRSPKSRRWAHLIPSLPQIKIWYWLPFDGGEHLLGNARHHHNKFLLNSRSSWDSLSISILISEALCSFCANSSMGCGAFGSFARIA